MEQTIEKIHVFIIGAFPSDLDHPLQLDFCLHDLRKEAKPKYTEKHSLGFWTSSKGLRPGYFRNFAGVIMIKKRLHPKRTWAHEMKCPLLNKVTMLIREGAGVQLNKVISHRFFFWQLEHLLVKWTPSQTQKIKKQNILILT